MNEDELPLDSDSSDEDYQPTGAEALLSEEESGNESAEQGSEPEEISDSAKKRKKRTKGRTRKKIKNVKSKSDIEDKKEEEEKENSEKAVSEEEKKKKSDSLWADFLRDCGPPVKKPSLSDAEEPTTKLSPVEMAVKKETKMPPAALEKEQVTTIVSTFAGEEVKIETRLPTSGKVVGRGSGGLSSLLNQLGKKGKLTTLEKSKLDWERFKDEQGIKEDIETYNKGKNGYLEKQDFLQRTDLRQFEIEKSMRASRRSLNR